MIRTATWLVLAAVSCSAFAQTKVGTSLTRDTGPVGPARPDAMGQAAAAVPSCEAAAFNPAALGLWTNRFTAIALFNPISAEWVEDLFEYRYLSGAVYLPFHLGARECGVGAAYSRLHLDGTSIEHNYGNPWVYRPWKIVTERLDFGIGYQGFPQLALGAGIGRVMSDFERDDCLWSAAAGALIQTPLEDILNVKLPCGRLFVTPAAAIAWSFFETDLEWGLDKSVLPKTRRLGISLTVGSRRTDKFEGFTVWQLVAAVDWERLLEPGAEDETRRGLELNLLETVALRVGCIDETLSVDTKGFSVSSRGLARMLSLIAGGAEAGASGSGLKRLLTDHLAVDYALTHWKQHMRYGSSDETQFHEVRVTVN